MSTRFTFTFGGYPCKIPRAAVAALEDELGRALEPCRSTYSRTFNAAAEGEEARYETEDRVPDDDADYLYVAQHVQYEGDLVKVRALVPSSMSLEVTGIGEPKPLIDLVTTIQRIEARLAHSPPPGTNTAGYVNTRVDVHVPGNSLLAIDEVLVIEDPCTESLQDDYLEKGWRIVAVCPQPDQRRPDYIVGRRRPAE